MLYFVNSSWTWHNCQCLGALHHRYRYKSYWSTIHQSWQSCITL